VLSNLTVMTPATSGTGCLVARAEAAGTEYVLLPIAARTEAIAMSGVVAPVDATRLPSAGLKALVVAGTAGTRVRTAPPAQIDQFHTTLGVSTSRRPLS
jgi:hypothetical protein